jgi:hypothetical protein
MSSNALRSKNPKFQQKNSTNTIIRHVEFIGQVASQSDFAPTQLVCNINNKQMFPWLSTLAIAYEKWKIKRMRFTYTTGSSTFAPGSAYMYIDYDPTDNAPAGINVMAQATDCFAMQAVYKNFTLEVIPRKFNQTKSFLIFEPQRILTPAELLLSVPFNLYFGSINTGEEPNVGYIWCDYEIELLIPSLEQIPMNLTMYGTFTCPLNATGFYNVDPLQASGQVYVNGNMDVRFIRNGYVFKQPFVGMVVLRAASPGFDSSRQFTVVPYNGSTLTNIYYELKDIAGGTDTWYCVFYINTNENAGFKYYGDLTGTTDETCAVSMWCGTSQWEYSGAGQIYAPIAEHTWGP